MSRADGLARLHYRAMLSERGERVRYLAKGKSEAIELELVAAGSDLEEVGEGGTTSARSYGWIALADELRRELGRLPEEGDTLTRSTEYSDDGAEKIEGEGHRVVRLGEPRVCRPHGRHGGLVRFTTVIA